MPVNRRAVEASPLLSRERRIRCKIKRERWYEKGRRNFYFFLQKRGTSLLNTYMDGRATTLHINELDFFNRTKKKLLSSTQDFDDYCSRLLLLFLMVILKLNFTVWPFFKHLHSSHPSWMEEKKASSLFIHHSTHKKESMRASSPPLKGREETLIHVLLNFEAIWNS